MKHTKLKLSFLFVFGVVFLTQAQTSLIVKENSGVSNSILLQNIKSLTFPTGNLAINNVGGSSTTYALSGIQNLHFSDIVSSVPFSENLNRNEVVLFPNPANNKLQFISKNEEFKNIKISIVDLQGKVLFKHELKNQNECIDVEKLSKGIYFCKIEKDNDIETIKFIKN